jgi:hypothetical protein
MTLDIAALSKPSWLQKYTSKTQLRVRFLISIDMFPTLLNSVRRPIELPMEDLLYKRKNISKKGSGRGNVILPFLYGQRNYNINVVIYG